jgi:ribosome modulation factor
MAWSPQILAQILEDGRKAAETGMSPAACPYIDDMRNERLDAWVEGYRAGTAAAASDLPGELNPL